MLRGRNRAQFLNEEAILQALTRDGAMSAADAAMYICGGCMEINPQGLTSDLFWSFRYNIGKTFELCVTGGRDLVDGGQRLPLTRSLLDCPDFESFYRYFEAEVERFLLLKFRALDIHATEIARLRPQFLVSSMVQDCFERGRNQMDGGARYADYGGSVIGIPNVANCLMALKRAVYDERFVSAADLLAALRTDFAGAEPLRQRLQRQPKYGELHPEADALMNRLLHSISRVFDGYRTCHGGRCKQVLLSFVFAPQMGAALGATVEGNHAGTPVAHGLTPFRPAAGLTTALRSYLALDNALVTGGASTMWDMDAEWITEELLSAVYGVFEQGGGQIFQGNMTSVKDLERALADPAAHPELIVRVGGFSSRFHHLRPEEQREVISRRRWK
jgi:formate C-acetyltransferase